MAATWPLFGKFASKARGEDWPAWRGPHQNSSSAGTGLIEAWDPAGGEGSNLLWKRTDLGTRSTPIVLNDKLYCLVRDKPGTANEGEKVVCLNAATGKTLWEYAFNVYLSEVPDTRVAWSSVVGDPETGRIYAQGVCGYFCCLEGATGKLVWHRSLAEELGVITTFGGRTNVPVIFEDMMLISAVVVGWGDKPEFGGLARPSHRFMAFDKATGGLRWIQGTGISPPDTTYSTPTTAVIGGEAQLIFGAADGKVWSFRPRTGEVLWHYPFSRRGLNVSPLVENDRVYITHSEENIVGATQGAAVAIDATQRGDLKDKHVWLQYQIMSGKSSPVMVDGKLWTIDDRAKLHILDAESGKEVGKRTLGTVMTGTPLYADGKVFVCTSTGRWYILRPSGSGRRVDAEVVHSLRLEGDAADGSPIAAHGRVFLPTSEAIYCLGNAALVAAAAPRGAGGQPAGRAAADRQAAAEGPVEPGAEAAFAQLVPFDSLVQPGQQQAFEVRLYNKQGQFLRVAKAGEAKFTLTGPGEISAQGVFTAPSGSVHAATLVQCMVGATQGKARVRIVPPLPWSWDFNQGDDMPITWVGGRVRYVLREVAGERVAVKRDVLPTPADPNNKLGTRSQAFMGPVDLANYVIQADFCLTEKNGRKPDVGLINSGYTLALRADDKKLRIYSWPSHEYRTYASRDLEPQIGVWYRMKLRVDQQESTALVRGKMWLRDESEPEEWSLEMTDARPQRNGSPGVFGKSQETEFYMDNVKVEQISAAG